MACPAKRPRAPKTTREKFVIYLKELEQDSYFREQRDAPDQETSLSNKWKRITALLNATGGPRKDVAGWKKTFVDWKFQVRKRARVLRGQQKETGNEGPPEKPLNDLETRLLALTGTVVVEGVQGVPELGINNEENLQTAREEQNEINIIEENLEELPRVETTASTKRTNISRKNTTLNSTVDKFRASKEKETSILSKINNNLETLVRLKQEEIELQKLKIRLKYNVEFDEEEEKSR